MQVNSRRTRRTLLFALAGACLLFVMVAPFVSSLLLPLLALLLGSLPLLWVLPLVTEIVRPRALAVARPRRSADPRRFSRPPPSFL